MPMKARCRRRCAKRARKPAWTWPPTRCCELGRFDYRPKKDLHLFATLMPRFDVAQLYCESQFSQYATGQRLPEMDGYDWVGFDQRGRALHRQDGGRAARPAEPAARARRVAGRTPVALAA